jgi:hypothetical protein
MMTDSVRYAIRRVEDKVEDKGSADRHRTVDNSGIVF